MTQIEKRFLILDRKNVPQKPADHGYGTADVKNGKKFSPSFLDPTKARKFGAYLADKYPGDLFFLAEIAGCVTVPEGAVWADAVQVPLINEAVPAANYDVTLDEEE